jgi:hypothetical protein
VFEQGFISAQSVALAVLWHSTNDVVVVAKRLFDRAESVHGTLYALALLFETSPEAYFACKAKVDLLQPVQVQIGCVRDTVPASLLVERIETAFLFDQLLVKEETLHRRQIRFVTHDAE